MILPYIDNMYEFEGAFIDRNNRVLRLGPLIHEGFARQEIERLNEDDKVLYNKWIESYYKGNLFTSPYSFASDFLTMVLGYDKIETILYHVISTSSHEPYERFYNYLLMGFTIQRLPKYIYKNGKFVKQRITLNNENDYVEEIENIKKLVPQKDRHIFKK